ncbi:MAG TPA: DUF2249 domain-containing protein [Telluria sp.]|nr:DUF2249 domain-containing protein [Telluria sp.]
MPHDCSTPATDTGMYAFDARGVARRFRHAAIFGALQALTPGETMRFYNDHDPLPLLAQLDNFFGPRIEMAYVAREAAGVIIDFRIVS